MSRTNSNPYLPDSKSYVFSPPESYPFKLGKKMNKQTKNKSKMSFKDGMAIR